MLNDESGPQKTGGTDAHVTNSTKTVALRTGHKITVEEATWNHEKTLLSVSTDRKDAKIPAEHVEAILESDYKTFGQCDDGFSPTYRGNTPTSYTGEGVVSPPLMGERSSPNTVREAGNGGESDE